ncbi:hypothetical protein [Nocardia sp. CC227C]|uniref:hypothetical protein n=1 Tax=Nocardia sp. CC227C TaxID=3044562 RepID=UPI00278C2DC2|nr:hypothetical protein [Nocardia sp. CC227C]
MLRTDVEALRVMAAGVRGEADAIGGIDPVGLIATVGRAMPNSAIGSAAVELSEPLRTALRGMAGQVRGFAAAADSGATTYEALDQALTERLDGYLRAPS